MRIDVIEDVDGLERLSDAWRSLREHARRTTPFQSPEWLIPWCSAFLDAGELRALALFSGNRLAALVPMVRRSSADGASLALAGEGISDYLDCVLAADADDDVFLCLEHAIRDETSRIGELRAEGVPAWSALLEAFADLRTCVRPSTRCPVVSLTPARDHYFRDLPAWLRRNLRRSKKRLEQMGSIRWEIAQADNLDELLEALFELHAQRWATKGEPGVLADPRVQAFHRDSAPRLVQSGALRLHALRLDGRVVGVLHVLIGARAYQYAGGYDPALADCSVGSFLIEHAMKDAIASGIAAYDFLRGEEPYKYDWHARDTFTYSMTLGRRIDRNHEGVSA